MEPWNMIGLTISPRPSPKSLDTSRNTYCTVLYLSHQDTRCTVPGTNVPQVLLGRDAPADASTSHVGSRLLWRSWA